MVKGFGSLPNTPVKKAQSASLQSATDCTEVQAQLMEHFGELNDPRNGQGVLHPFLTIIMIALLATIGGAQGGEDIETYGLSHQRWLGSFLTLPFGIPKADTYRRVFEKISPSAFERSFQSWLKSLVTDLGVQVIPIDGKTLIGSYDRNQRQSALHTVSAKASENRLFLGQVKVDAKSNEIRAIPALLELLDISGCIITIDAMGTQHEIARCLRAKGADYVLALKANHPTLFAQVKQWFEIAPANDFEGIEHSDDIRVETGHHRTEKRQVWAVAVEQMGELYKQTEWAGLPCVVTVVRTRHLWN